MKNISINIWDDYTDDGYLSPGESQNTYAYIESDLDDSSSKELLEQFKNLLITLKSFDPSITLDLNFYDSSKVYPSLIGTEHEIFLFKKWQLEIFNISHSKREAIIQELMTINFIFNDMKVIIYSES